MKNPLRNCVRDLAPLEKQTRLPDLLGSLVHVIKKHSLAVAAGATAVHAKAAPDLVDRFLVGSELVGIGSDQHDVIVGHVGTNQDLALGGLTFFIDGRDRCEAVIRTDLFGLADLY